MSIQKFENRQWKFIIVDMEDGSVVGTDQIEVAQEYAHNDQNFVINMSTCQILVTAENGTEDDELTIENIPEQQLYKF